MTESLSGSSNKNGRISPLPAMKEKETYKDLQGFGANLSPKHDGSLLYQKTLIPNSLARPLGVLHPSERRSLRKTKSRIRRMGDALDVSSSLTLRARGWEGQAVRFFFLPLESNRASLLVRRSRKESDPSCVPGFSFCEWIESHSRSTVSHYQGCRWMTASPGSLC